MYRNFLIAIFAIVASMFTMSAHAIEWREYSDSVFAASKASDLPVMIFYKAKWCPWCQKMDSTFADSGVALLVERNFIAVKVDIEDDAPIAAQYHVKKIPALVFLNSNGQVLDKTYGYKTPTSMIQWLQRMANQFHKASK